MSNEPTYEELMEALRLANDAMNYMGDALNEMDVAIEEDELATTAAFIAVRRVLGLGDVDED